jgi:hypothetical protein
MHRYPQHVVAHNTPDADNPVTSNAHRDPRRALVRFLAELLVEDYMAEYQCGQNTQTQREKQEKQ